MQAKSTISLMILAIFVLFLLGDGNRIVAQETQPTQVPGALPDLYPDHRAEEDRNPFAVRLLNDRELDANWSVLRLPPSLPEVPGGGGDFFFAGQSLAGSYSSTCVLGVDGGVKCWGDNSRGQLGDGTTTYRFTPVNVVGLSSGVTAISSMHKHTCALTTGGGVKCWGYNLHGELGNGTTTDSLVPVDVSGLNSGVIQISAGGFHTCALMAGGSVKCWGANWHGEVGDGSKIHRYAPVNVDGIYDALSISVGKYHSCALTSSSGVKCWGYNKFGQIGNGTTEDQQIPVTAVGTRQDIAGIFLGSLHSCVLTTAGGVRCWGENSEGQLGDGTKLDRYTAVDVVGLSSGVVTLTGGGYFTCALMSSGGVKCWGDNWAGQIGDGSRSRQKTPVDVVGLGEVVTSLETGESHTCAVTASGKVKCWGSNSFGQLGDGTSALKLSPVNVYNLTDGLVGIAGGGMHTCAVTSGGGVKCWGNNYYGQLGDGTIVGRLRPVSVYGLGGAAVAVTTGDFHTCALLSSGSIQCWGYNKYGQLGNNSNEQSHVPVFVESLGGVASAIDAGANHTCALLTSGFVKCWGDNFGGQLGDGTLEERYVPVRVTGLTDWVAGSITAGENHSCALSNTGGLRCWGDNAYGEIGDGTTGKRKIPVDVYGLHMGVKGISGGANHTCAIMDNGGVKCWGQNVYGQLGSGTTTQSLVPMDVVGLSEEVTALSTGSTHTCAKTKTGSIKCWGDNWTGQLGNGTTTGSIVPTGTGGITGGVQVLATGSYFTCILDSSGGAKCWGTNGNGQIGDGSTPWRLTPGDVTGLHRAELRVNYPTGSPGSYFKFTGVDFLPNSPATVTANKNILTQSLTTDGSGSLIFSISTLGASEGYYTVELSVDISAGVGFMIDPDAPYRAREGSGPLLVLPGGIGHSNIFYLPELGR